MNVSKPILSSLVLFAVSAGMWLPMVLDVNVTNFPLDEQGNLRVSQMNGEQNVTVTNFPTEPEPKTIVVCENYTVTYSGSYVVWLPFVVDIEGFQKFSVFITYLRPYPNSVNLNFHASCLNITATSSASSGLIELSPSSEWENRGVTGLPVESPDLRFNIVIGNHSVEFTLVLYCY